MKEKRINVRLSDNLYGAVSDVSDRFGVNKSQVVRLALTADLAKLNQSPIAKLGSETREELIKNTQEIFNQLDDLSRSSRWIANNINQLARQSYTGQNVTIDEEYLKEYSDNLSVTRAMIDELKNEVSSLWRHLV